MVWSWTDSLGVALMGGTAPAHVTRWARAAEQAGFGSLWFVEDYFHPGAFSLAAAAAAVTTRPAIGLGVINPYTRHPVLLTMETAALAGVADGRVVLGLGTSNRNWMETQLGIPFRTPLAALAECVEIVRRLWTGERLTYPGRCFTLHGVALEAKPAQAELPILLGVKGPKAVRLAGEIADGVHCSIMSSPAHVARVRATTARAHHDFPVIAYVPVALDDDGGRARRWTKPVLARYLGVLHGQSILRDAGLSEAETRPFREALAAGTPAAHLVSDDLVAAFAVAGTPDECRRALRRWADAGLTALIAVPPPGVDVEGQVARVGAELAPYWKEMRSPCR
jgi:5,10-methylenetetrahydromethanopterin reductase